MYWQRYDLPVAMEPVTPRTSGIDIFLPNTPMTRQWLCARRLQECVTSAKRRMRIVHDGRRFARAPAQDVRSEEHTSELQSLMRISYAVFCLQKKTNNPSNESRHQKH